MKITLSGCAPVPLAHYLKALGVLRVVAEASECDQTASAYWSGDKLLLQSRFNEDELVDFLLRLYAPTSVIAPWNGGSGFYPKDNREAISAIEGSAANRFECYRMAIKSARLVIDSLQLKEKPDGDTKEMLLHSCRNTLPEAALDWLDAVFVLGQDGPKYPPLLGTGGNDGRLEFTNNFMQRIVEIVDPVTGAPTDGSERWLRSALFATPSQGVTGKAPIGQFFPGAAGGANGTSGFDAPSNVNPWDFVLMIEGALLFAGASVKRLESTGSGALIYPFCVRQAGVGYGSASSADEKDARCEMWMPLWERPTTLAELRAVFSEGRAQVGGTAARNGVDFARAAVTLGVDRGISSFQRYGFQVRNGLAYFATPLERVAVRRNGRADLLADIDRWLDRLRQKAGPQANPEAPASVASALKEIERAILDLCRDDAPDRLQAVLVSLGRAERALARSYRWTTGDNAHLQPLQRLNPGWLTQADTHCPEFRLARSLAGVRARLGKETHWLRQNLEPLEMGANADSAWVRWDKVPGNDVVWHEGDLTDSLNAIFARRMIGVEKSGATGWPDWSPRPASLDDITRFIEGRTDDGLLADLLWGLSLVDWEKIVREERAAGQGTEDQTGPRYDADNCVPSSLYALLRLCFRRPGRSDNAIPLVPAIQHRAAAGQGEAASRFAARRLLGSGYSPLVPSVSVQGDPARRTAAALLFPISRRDFCLLENSILQQFETNKL